MLFHSKVLRITDALEEFQVQYVVVGGVAIIMHGNSRFTEDVDLFVKNTPENVEKLQRALQVVYPDDEYIKEITTDELTDYPVIRYGTPDLFYIDVIDRIGTMFTFDDIESEVVNYEDHTVRIATAETLYKMKKDTLRLKDKMDCVFLEYKIRGGK